MSGGEKRFVSECKVCLIYFSASIIPRHCATPFAPDFAVRHDARSPPVDIAGANTITTSPNRPFSKLLQSSTSRLSRHNRAEPPTLNKLTIDQCQRLPSPPDDDSSTARYPSLASSIAASSKHPIPNEPSSTMLRPGAAPLFSDSPNARSKTITTASGPYTHGILNQHPATPFGYSIGVAEDTGSRRTMEDAHSFVADFAGVRGQGYFAVFDGHAGKHAAEWCGEHFHEELIQSLASYPSSAEPTGAGSDAQAANGSSKSRTTSVPDVLNRTFHAVDARLSKLAEDGQTHSGCTAVTAFLRLEDDEGNQPPEYVETALEWMKNAPPNPVGVSTNTNLDAPKDGLTASPSGDSLASPGAGKEGKSGFNSKMMNAVRSITGRSPSAEPEEIASSSSTTSSPSSSVRPSTDSTSSTATSHTVTAADVPSSSASVTTSSTSTKHGVAAFKGATRRVLYTANAGDARAVLGRGGRAVRLTYDHKGSDAQEAKRIKEAGGFVMNNRVNGVLAVTRSLGDSAMKEFVVGSPYTTETLLGDEDDVLIIACDGLWDVIEDQAAIDLIRPIITSGSPTSAQEAASKLVRYALDHFSSDNISVLVVKLEGGWR